jgi:hypothetical protein
VREIGHYVRVRGPLTIAAFAIALALAGCGGSAWSNGRAETPTTVPGRSSPTTSRSCGPQRENCPSAQAIDALVRLYEIGGATHSEARCLAPILGRGTQAVNQASDRPTKAQTQAAVKCVGSEDRLVAIDDAIERWTVTHPTR